MEKKKLLRKEWSIDFEDGFVKIMRKKDGYKEIHSKAKFEKLYEVEKKTEKK